VTPIYQLAAASAAVRALLGTEPRFTPFGAAPQKDDPLYGVPYAVYQTIYGTPENYLGQRPDVDNWGVQVDVYAKTVPQANAAAIALREAFEGVAHVVAYNGDAKDPPTGLFRFSFTVEFWTPR
jgi:hypothetical protein